MACTSCGDDDKEWMHHGHGPMVDCFNEEGESRCHTVCKNCDAGLCEECGV